jgi:glutathione synthase/RimK-type ligase-like ATP-grasp enzyme
MTSQIDLLALISRPDFPTGNGVAGDCFGLRRLARRRADLNIVILELNSQPTRLYIEPGKIVVAQAGIQEVDFSTISAALYLPICLEVEETNLSPARHSDPYSLFAAQQWRPVTEFVEYHLTNSGVCINPPHHVRRTNNKLIQLEALSKAGFSIPTTCVATNYPDRGRLANWQTLIAKNVSEGGWKSPTEFSPARATDRSDYSPPYPVVYQQPLTSDHELRCYVMGDIVYFVQLDRRQDIVDVRTIDGGRPRARLVSGRPDWAARLVASARHLGLDYAVIDAMPDGDELNILEINANGVWWFLPPTIGAEIEGHFHRFVERFIDLHR